MIHRNAHYKGVIRLHRSSLGLSETCDSSEIIGVLQKIKDANRSISSCGLTSDRQSLSFASYVLESSELRTVVTNYVQRCILKNKS